MEPIYTCSLSGHTTADTTITEGGTLYQTTSTIYGQWHYNDTETDIEKAWLSLGTYPQGEDVTPRSEVNISTLGESSLPLGSVTPQDNGKLISH